jgi:hypothetical protein
LQKIPLPEAGGTPCAPLYILQGSHCFGAEKGQWVTGSEKNVHHIVFLQLSRECRNFGVNAAEEGYLPVSTWGLRENF